MDGNIPEVWEKVTHANKRLLLKRTTNNNQVKEPNDLRGGKLTDPLGLGRTLTMISLIG